MMREPSGTTEQKECKNQYIDERMIANGVQAAAKLFDDEGKLKKPEDSKIGFILGSDALKTFRDPEGPVRNQTEREQSAHLLKALESFTDKNAPAKTNIAKEDLDMLKQFAKQRHEDFGNAVDSCLVQKDLPKIPRDENGRIPW